MNPILLFLAGLTLGLLPRPVWAPAALTIFCFLPIGIVRYVWLQQPEFDGPVLGVLSGALIWSYVGYLVGRTLEGRYNRRLDAENNETPRGDPEWRAKRAV